MFDEATQVINKLKADVMTLQSAPQLTPEELERVRAILAGTTPPEPVEEPTEPPATGTLIVPHDDIQSTIDKGGRFILAPGIYPPLKVGSDTALIAEQPGTAIISGAIDWSGDWFQSGDMYRKEFTYSLHQHEAKRVHGSDKNGNGASARGLAHRAAQQPHQLIWDGVPMKTVYNINHLEEGAFFFDGDAKTGGTIYAIFPGKNAPVSGRVQTSTSQYLIKPKTDDTNNVVLDGLVLRYCANTGIQGALHFYSGCDNWQVSNTTVEWSNSEGISVRGKGHTFTRVKSNFHGQCGWAGYGMQDCKLIQCEGSGNVNKDGIDPKWHAGNKFVSGCNRNLIKDFQSIGNDGPGIWFDIYNFDNVIDGFYVQDALAFGVHIEHHTQGTELGKCIVQNGIIKGTRKFDGIGSGLQIQGAIKNVVFRNIELVGNADGAVYYKKGNEPRGDSGFNVFENITYTNNGNGNRWAIQGDMAVMPDTYNMPMPKISNWK